MSSPSKTFGYHMPPRKNINLCRVRPFWNAQRTLLYNDQGHRIQEKWLDWIDICHYWGKKCFRA